jgi:hypothetical protein
MNSLGFDFFALNPKEYGKILGFRKFSNFKRLIANKDLKIPILEKQKNSKIEIIFTTPDDLSIN